jgi:hypothetical protein
LQELGVDEHQRRLPVKLPQPLPALIKHWVQANADENLLASLAALNRQYTARDNDVSSSARGPVQTQKWSICAS